jgi:hypothetical protein
MKRISSERKISILAKLLLLYNMTVAAVALDEAAGARRAEPVAKLGSV